MLLASKSVSLIVVALGLAACGGGNSTGSVERHFSSSAPVFSGEEAAFAREARLLSDPTKANGDG